MSKHDTGKGRLVSLEADSSVYMVDFVLEVDIEVVRESKGSRLERSATISSPSDRASDSRRGIHSKNPARDIPCPQDPRGMAGRQLRHPRGFRTSASVPPELQSLTSGRYD